MKVVFFLATVNWFWPLCQWMGIISLLGHLTLILSTHWYLAELPPVMAYSGFHDSCHVLDTYISGSELFNSYMYLLEYSIVLPIVLFRHILQNSRVLGIVYNHYLYSCHIIMILTFFIIWGGITPNPVYFFIYQLYTWVMPLSHISDRLTIQSPIGKKTLKKTKNLIGLRSWGNVPDP